MSSDDQLFFSKAIIVCTQSVEQPYVYNAVEFRDSIRNLLQLIEGLKQQEQGDEWLRVLECTNYFVKIVLKGTREIIAKVDLTDKLGSGE